MFTNMMTENGDRKVKPQW